MARVRLCVCGSWFLSSWFVGREEVRRGKPLSLHNTLAVVWWQGAEACRKPPSRTIALKSFTGMTLTTTGESAVAVLRRT